jgi:hypothetical protein
MRVRKIGSRSLAYLILILSLSIIIGCMTVSNQEVLGITEPVPQTEVATVTKDDKPAQIEESLLTLYNLTKYEIRNVYVSGGQMDGKDVLEGAVIYPGNTKKLAVPGGKISLVAALRVGDEFVEVRDTNDFMADKSYNWSIGEKFWSSAYAQGYRYLASYGYMDETYGYMGY